MSTEHSHIALSDPKDVVIVIPTYNNSATLRRVIDGVLVYNLSIIVVNDGSTDDTANILSEYQHKIDVLSLAKNAGKGKALRVAFKHALQNDFGYAITIDSDGQHYPDDIPVFLDCLHQEVSPVLLIGSRNMTHDSIPKKSSFGNKFSNFWFWVETGIKLTDTQSGFRAYPLQYLPKQFYTTKFEFEIEVIVRTAWSGVAVKNVPIRVLYDPLERVSHFRPFQDFTRISILNTVLVFFTFFYILPRNFFRSFKKKSLIHFIRENIFESNDSPVKKATSVALGVFTGIAPVWGFQTIIVMTLAVFFRLNKALAFAFSNISIPPMIPFIIYASLLLGGFAVQSDDEWSLSQWRDFSFDTVQSHVWQYVVGSLILATSMALLLGLSSYIFFHSKQSKQL